MNLLVFRHGAASPRVPSGGTDRDRPLSTEGRAAFTEAAGAWATFAPAPSIIVSSPLLRAVQTTEILVNAFGGSIEVMQDAGLEPEADPDSFAGRIPDGDDVYLVSHMPFVGELLARLLAGSERAHIPLSTGQGVWIDLPARHSWNGRLVAALTTSAAKRLVE